MLTSRLSIDLDALVKNWRALGRHSPTAQTGAVLKADAYGLGTGPVAKSLASAGAKCFFVAYAEEGAALRKTLGADIEIFVLSGHMSGDTALLKDAGLIPILSSAEQITRHFDTLSDHIFAVQLDTGMNRLGLKMRDWAALSREVIKKKPRLITSHLACADNPTHPMNEAQLSTFLSMTQGMGIPRSLAATGGILLGPRYHFDLTRPGIGLYGGLPFKAACRVVNLSLPIIQTREIGPGETVGYSATWRAQKDSVIATLSGGYADGLLRSLSNGGALWHEGTPCPMVGRVSMDMITVDISDLDETPQSLSILGPDQSIDDLAAKAGTISYEMLTSLGFRYTRTYLGGGGR